MTRDMLKLSTIKTEASYKRGRMCVAKYSAPFASVIPLGDAWGQDLSVYGYTLRGREWVFTAETSGEVEAKIDLLIRSITEYP